MEILNQGGGKIGSIQYNILEDIPDLNLQRCIVVGKDEMKYVVLLVKSSSLKDECTRIGTGTIKVLVCQGSRAWYELYEVYSRRDKILRILFSPVSSGC